MICRCPSSWEQIDIVHHCVIFPCEMVLSGWRYTLFGFCFLAPKNPVGCYTSGVGAKNGLFVRVHGLWIFRVSYVDMQPVLPAGRDVHQCILYSCSWRRNAIICVPAQMRIDIQHVLRGFAGALWFNSRPRGSQGIPKWFSFSHSRGSKGTLWCGCMGCTAAWLDQKIWRQCSGGAASSRQSQ